MATQHASTNQHTPGPWKVVPTMNGHAVTDADNRSIINCSSPQQEANARLIAAAPEMLACLREAAFALSEVAGYLPDESDADQVSANALERLHTLLATFEEA